MISDKTLFWAMKIIYWLAWLVGLGTFVLLAAFSIFGQETNGPLDLINGLDGADYYDAPVAQTTGTASRNLYSIIDTAGINDPAVDAATTRLIELAPVEGHYARMCIAYYRGDFQSAILDGGWLLECNAIPAHEATSTTLYVRVVRMRCFGYAGDLSSAKAEAARIRPIQSIYRQEALKVIGLSSETSGTIRIR